jgi:hypothetical protein
LTCYHKITIFEKNPEGVVIVKYGSAPGAEMCIHTMDKRSVQLQAISCWFNQQPPLGAGILGGDNLNATTGMGKPTTSSLKVTQMSKSGWMLLAIGWIIR